MVWATSTMTTLVGLGIHFSEHKKLFSLSNIQESFNETIIWTTPSTDSPTGNSGLSWEEVGGVEGATCEGCQGGVTLESRFIRRTYP